MQEVKIILVQLAAYYQRELTPEVLRMYSEDLKEFSYDQVLHAANKYRRDYRNKTFPLPAHLMEIIKPQVTDKNEAREAVALIWEAVAKFGWPNGTTAKAYIGELGWRIVQRFGGWVTICQEADSDGGILRAQMRDLAEATIERAKAGLEGVKPGIPTPEAIPDRIRGILPKFDGIDKSIDLDNIKP